MATDSSFRVVERSGSAASLSGGSSASGADALSSDASLSLSLSPSLSPQLSPSLSLSPRAWRSACAAAGPAGAAPPELLPRGRAPRDEFIADAASLGDYLRWVGALRQSARSPAAGGRNRGALLQAVRGTARA